MGFLSDLWKGKRPEVAARNLFQMFPEMLGRYEELAGQLGTGFEELGAGFQADLAAAQGMLSEDFANIQALFDQGETTYDTMFTDVLNQYDTNLTQGREFLQQAYDEGAIGRDATLQMLREDEERQQRMATANLAGLGLSGSTVATSMSSDIARRGGLARGQVMENYSGMLAGLRGQQSALEERAASARAELMQSDIMGRMNLMTQRVGAGTDYLQSRQNLFGTYQGALRQAQQAAFESPAQQLERAYQMGYGNVNWFNNARQGGIGASVMGALAGAGAQAGMAALMGSDIRLKNNLVPIGKHHGLTVYKWEWNKAAKPLGYEGESRGYIAQEVEVLFPEAVMEHNGYKHINYEILNSIFDKLNETNEIEMIPEDQVFANESATEVTYG